MTPSLRYSAEFVLESLPERASRLLEVGCGDGALARFLLDRSFAVVGLDNDPAAVASARARGVDARLMSWPAPVEGRFDAVLFTRSLHHIGPLDEAVAAAVAALGPGGSIVVEDFCAEGGSERSAAWFERTVDDLAELGRLRAGASIAAILAKAAPDHAHELHASDSIAAALGARGSVEQAGAAYYFRYLEPELDDAEGAQGLLEAELEGIASGRIDPLGRRFVLVPARV
jgi:SAM-dependent methyltransferase